MHSKRCALLAEKANAGPTALTANIAGIDWSVQRLALTDFPSLPLLSLDAKSPTFKVVQAFVANVAPN